MAAGRRCQQQYGGYANIWYMRVPLFSRFGGGGALLQIAPIGTYTMSYYLTARAKVSSAAGGSRRPETDFALDISCYLA